MASKILLIGESCVDRVLTCVHQRMSPENEAVPVYKVIRDEATEGMVQIVSKHMVDLGLEHEVLTNLFQDAITKTRVYVNGVQTARIDEDTQVCFSELGEIPWLYENAKKFDAIVVSDYGKGLLSKEVIDIICTSGARVYLDPHPNNDIAQYRNLHAVKLNEKEMVAFTGEGGFSGAQKLKDITGAKHVFLTLGPGGIEYYGDEVLHSDSVVTNPRNVSGAGDVVLASIVNDMEKGMSVPAALRNAMVRVGAYVEGQ